MLLDRRNLPGVVGGIVFALVWLIISGFENYLQSIFGGLVFMLTWFAVNWIVYKSEKGKR